MYLNWQKSSPKDLIKRFQETIAMFSYHPLLNYGLLVKLLYHMLNAIRKMRVESIAGCLSIML